MQKIASVALAVRMGKSSVGMPLTFNLLNVQTTIFQCPKRLKVI